MDASLPAPLHKGLLREAIVSFVSFRDSCLLLAASRGVRAAYAAPTVPEDLLVPVPGRLNIRRELALGRLMELGRRRSPGAIGEILARLRCAEEHDYLRCWALKFLLPLAEPGDGWAAEACLAVLALGGNRSRSEALRGLVRTATSGTSSRLLLAVVATLSASDLRSKVEPSNTDVIHEAWCSLGKLARLLPADGGETASELLQLLSDHLDSASDGATARPPRTAAAPRGAAEPQCGAPFGSVAEELADKIAQARLLLRPLGRGAAPRALGGPREGCGHACAGEA